MEKRRTEAQILQRYGVLFENVKKDTVLAAELAEYGYDATAIAQGEALYNTLIEKYDANKTETAQETTVYAVFSNAFENTLSTYKTDRKKAKIVFKNGLSGTLILGQNQKQIFTALPEYFTMSD